MPLFEAMQQRGYSFRQHLEEETWTHRKLTVVELSTTQRSALESEGTQGLARKLADDGVWSFPAMDIDEPLPVRPHVICGRSRQPTSLVVVPASGAAMTDSGREFVEVVERRFGLKLRLVSDTEADLDMLRSLDLVVFGGAHENRFSLDMALRYQTCFLDARAPGDGGWAVTTHVGLDAGGRNVLQIAASPACRPEALEAVLASAAAVGDLVVVGPVHRVLAGRDMRQHFPAWEEFAASLPRGIPQLTGGRAGKTTDPVALADLLRRGLDSGGPDVNLVNNRPIDLAILCARYYQLSGDRRALQLFRELLFRLADYYLKTPEGASYPSDLDFRLGHLILYYARLEHEPVFSEEDRVILANLLLACTRSVYEYALKCWPVEPDGPTRHNHETFAARSLVYASDYFARYAVPDAPDWRRHADTVFSGGIWRRFKQEENANLYEQLAFEHAAEYSAFTGRGLTLMDLDCLRWAARRNMVATDNFLRPVDYGDSGIRMASESGDVPALLLTSRRRDPELQWFANELFERNRNHLPPPIMGIPGLRLSGSGVSPSCGGWEMVPLDVEFLRSHCPELPESFAFDKLAFRSGWRDESHYVLIEGVGNDTISHSHNEVNGIVRLNHLGRHWVVSNGYGRRAGLANVARSFSTRIRGPEDHNMLVLRRGQEAVTDLPVCSALLRRGRTDGLAFVTSALLDYGGTDWFRTVLILTGRLALVIDRIDVVQPGLKEAHVEWNCLGEPTDRGAGCCQLHQQGVFMDVSSASGWDLIRGVSDQSADWKRVLESGAYPHATFPLTKLLFPAPNVEPGRPLCLVTLLAARHETDPGHSVSEPEPGLARVRAANGRFPDVALADEDLVVRCEGPAMDVRFAPVPVLPDALQPRSARARSRGAPAAGSP